MDRKSNFANLFELIGLIIGDGNILYNYKNKWNRISISGDVEQYFRYFEKICDFIEVLSGKRPTIRVRKKLNKGSSLELYLDNKQFVDFLVKDLKLNYGNKTFIVRIPTNFLNWKYSKHILRGIFEADGSLYFSKIKRINYPTYPRVEIRTSSEKLANQIFEILKKNDFCVQFMKTKYSDFKIYLSGEKMLEKWISEIGFSNDNTISKYLFWKKYGFYIPRISFIQRERILNRKGDISDVAPWPSPVRLGPAEPRFVGSNPSGASFS